MPGGAAVSKAVSVHPFRMPFRMKRRGASAGGDGKAEAMRIATAEDAARILAPMFASAEAERIVVVHLDSEQRLLGVTVEAEGEAEDVELPVAAIAASALRLGAEGIIVAHNHPSGNPEPSNADREATRRLADILRPIGVRLVDHLVFGGGETSSFRALGLL
jgi:DNA repair protein RadC